MERLSELRDEIDNLDASLLELLNKRAAAAHEIGVLKKAGNMTIVDPEREREVIERLRNLNEGPLGNEAVEKIYREIISACVGIEEDI